MKRQALSPLGALKLCAFRVAASGARVSPAAMRTLAPAAGDLAWVLNVAARRRVRANLRGLLPNAGADALRRTERSIFRSIARYYAELLALPVTSPRTLERRAIVEGYEHLTAARAEGRGLILASVHVGPGELVMQGLAARGVFYTAMIERLNPEPLGELVRALREAHGHRYVFAGVAGAKELIRVVRAGGVAALLVDRDVLGTGTLVTFLGRTIRAPAGPIELAALTGAPLLPACAAWLPDGRYAVRILPPLHIERSARKGDALRREIERLLALFAPHFRAHADQWLVLQRFWEDESRNTGAGYTGSPAPW